MIGTSKNRVEIPADVLKKLENKVEHTKKVKNWRDWELKVLYEYYGKLTSREIGEIIGRSGVCIQKKANNLGIKGK